MKIVDICKRSSPALVIACSLLTANLVGAAEQDSAAKEASSRLNHVLMLDGKSGGVRVSDSPSLHMITNGITLEIWCKAESFYPENGAVNSLIRKNVAEGAENFFLRFRTIQGQPWIEMSPGKQIGVLRAPYDFATNRWYHLAGVYDGKDAAVFVNGRRVKSETLNGPMVIDDSDLFIGKGDPEWSSGEFFHGAVDEVRIWNIARSPEQIQQDIQRTLTGKEAGLIALWNFDDDSAKDQSGHKNDGHLMGEAHIVERGHAPE